MLNKKNRVATVCPKIHHLLLGKNRTAVVVGGEERSRSSRAGE
jgi:ribosome-interacting GTPase 1